MSPEHRVPTGRGSFGDRHPINIAFLRSARVLTGRPRRRAHLAVAPDRVGCRGLRRSTLAYHRACGLPPAAVERSGALFRPFRAGPLRFPPGRSATVVVITPSGTFHPDRSGTCQAH